jgi:hypothetical protein
MGAHGDKIAAFLFNPFHDFGGGVAKGEFGLRGNVSGLKFLANFLQVGGVIGDFGTHGVGAVGSGGPSVRDVEQHEAAVRDFRELFDVFDDRAVGWGAVQRD